MKIGMVNQPWSVNPPINSADSIAILSYEMARRLARSHEVISYSPGFRGEAASEIADGILFRRVSRVVDRVLKPLRLLDSTRLLAPRRPHVASVFYYPGYIFQVARDLARQQCDIIHLHNFSQYARVIRAFNPFARIVLHMHCDWLTMLDPQMVRGRMERADLILGVSDFITKRLKNAFPDFGHGAVRFIMALTQTISALLTRPMRLRTANASSTRVASRPRKACTSCWMRSSGC